MYNQITTFLGIAGNIPSNSNIQNHLAGLNYVKKSWAKLLKGTIFPSGCL
jgi:hypothetical protein